MLLVAFEYHCKATTNIFQVQCLSRTSTLFGLKGMQSGVRVKPVSQCCKACALALSCWAKTHNIYIYYIYIYVLVIHTVLVPKIRLEYIMLWRCPGRFHNDHAVRIGRNCVLSMRLATMRSVWLPPQNIFRVKTTDQRCQHGRAATTIPQNFRYKINMTITPHGPRVEEANWDNVLSFFCSC